MTNTSNVSDRQNAANTPRPPWRQVVRVALHRLGGQASLQALYAEIDREYAAADRWTHWQAKVRQVVQLDPEIERVGEGVWRLKSAPHSSGACDPATPTS